MHTSALIIPGFSIHSGQHTAGTALPRHTHDDPTLCFLLSGRFTEYSRNVAMDCVSGTMKLMPAGEPHSNRFIAPETLGVRVDIARHRFSDSGAINALLDEPLVVTSEGPRSLMQRLIAELRVRDDAARMVVEGLLLELLGALSREHGGDHARVPGWIRQADDMLRAHFTTNISLARVAGSVGVAPATLARSYRTTYRMSIGERVRQLRLDQAARELIDGTETISIIAANAGFYDQSHFTSAFRRRYAMTPARFRQLRGARGTATS